jgi:hypothetical protein
MRCWHPTTTELAQPGAAEVSTELEDFNQAISSHPFITRTCKLDCAIAPYFLADSGSIRSHFWHHLRLKTIYGHKMWIFPTRAWSIYEVEETYWAYISWRDNSLADKPPKSCCTSMLDVYVLEWPTCDMNKPVQRASRPGVSQGIPWLRVSFRERPWSIHERS